MLSDYVLVSPYTGSDQCLIKDFFSFRKQGWRGPMPPPCRTTWGPLKRQTDDIIPIQKTLVLNQQFVTVIFI